MGFILITHLDPTHASMMVELLASHTEMKVLQAADGMPLEREHVYVIPPATYLSIHEGALHLSEPTERHGARLPFDFFLRSLAAEYSERAICVILSGTGTDGTLGLKAIKEKGGLVIAQSPDEAAYDGMPRSAITTGLVDFVLPVAKIPEIVANYGAQKHGRGSAPGHRCGRRCPELAGRDHRSVADADRAQFLSLQAEYAAAPDRAADGDGRDHRSQYGISAF
jgi:chemotaxis response regulator CheB